MAQQLCQRSQTEWQMTRDATPEAEQRRPEALADPEVEEDRRLLISLGLDEGEAQRLAKLDTRPERRHFHHEDAVTRRQKRVDIIRRYWLGEPEVAAARAPSKADRGGDSPNGAKIDVREVKKGR